MLREKKSSDFPQIWYYMIAKQRRVTQATCMYVILTHIFLLHSLKDFTVFTQPALNITANVLKLIHVSRGAWVLACISHICFAVDPFIHSDRVYDITDKIDTYEHMFEKYANSYNTSLCGMQHFIHTKKGVFVSIQIWFFTIDSQFLCIMRRSLTTNEHASFIFGCPFALQDITLYTCILRIRREIVSGPGTTY